MSTAATAFGWIGQIAQSVGAVLPRIEHIPATHEGVCFTRGGYKKKRAGIHIYLPLWSVIEQENITRRTLNLTCQTLTTEDEKSVVVSAVVVFRITDIVAALVKTDDIEDTLADCAQRAVKQIVGDTQLADLMSEDTDAEITEGMKADLEPYGAEVEKAFLNDATKVIPVRCFNDTVFRGVEV